MKTDQESRPPEAQADHKRAGRRRLLGALVGAPVIYTLPTVGATQAAGSLTCWDNAPAANTGLAQQGNGYQTDQGIVYDGKLVSAQCYASLTVTQITRLGSGSDLA